MMSMHRLIWADAQKLTDRPWLSSKTGSLKVYPFYSEVGAWPGLEAWQTIFAINGQTIVTISKSPNPSMGAGPAAYGSGWADH